MTIWIALASGIILGWLIEWIIDWLYWRRGIAGFYATEEELRNELTNVQSQLAESEQSMNELRSERDGLLGERDGLLGERDALLSEQGGLLSERNGLLSERDGLLSERNGLLGERDGLLGERNGLLGERDGLLSERDGLRGEEDGLRRERDELLSERDALLNEREEMKSQLEATATAKLAVEQQLEEAITGAKTAKQASRDDLEQIDGIGRVYEQKLFDSGIDTFAQLAVTPTERLRDIIQPAAWQHINFDSWVEQARKCAEVVIYDFLPYRLEEIRGIGPTYTKRLNAAGIMTFADLAHTPEKRLREIIAPRSGLKIDYAEWVKEARAFVALTTGDRPPLPLERIKGIGPVFATRLDLAGIHTYADLAKSSEDQLREIIGSRGIQIANLSRWIAEANAEINGTQENGIDATSSSNGATGSTEQGAQDETIAA